MCDHEVSSDNPATVEEPPSAASQTSGCGDYQRSTNKIILGTKKCHGNTNENLAALGSSVSDEKLSNITPDKVFSTKTEDDYTKMIVTPDTSKGEICKHCNESFPDHSVLVQHLIELIQDQSNIIAKGSTEKTDNQPDDKDKTNGSCKSQESSNVNVESVGKETNKSRALEDEEQHITAISDIKVDAGNGNSKEIKVRNQEITGDTIKCIDSRNKGEDYEEMADDNDKIIDLEKDDFEEQNNIAEYNHSRVESNDKSIINLKDEDHKMTVHSERNIEEDKKDSEDRILNPNKIGEEMGQPLRNVFDTIKADQKQKNNGDIIDLSQDEFLCYKCRICKNYFSSDLSASVHRLTSHSNLTQEELFFKFTTGNRQAKSISKEKKVINKPNSQKKAECDLKNNEPGQKVQETLQNDEDSLNNSTHKATSHVNLKRKLSQEDIPNKKLKIDESHRQIENKTDNDEETSTKLYKCPCGLHFISYKTIQKHVKECSPTNKLSKQECSKCGYLFTTDVLVNHLLKHHTNKECTFEIVSITSDLKALAVKECSKLIQFRSGVVTVPKPNKNTEVDKISETNKLDYILTNKKPINPSEEIPDFTKLDTKKCLYKCRQCNLHYLKLPSIHYHLKANHRSVFKIHKCELCGLRFPQRTLKGHIKFHHGKQKLQLKDLNIILMNASNYNEIDRAHYKSQQASSNIEKQIKKVSNIAKSKNPIKVVIGTSKTSNTSQDKLILKIKNEPIDRHTVKQSEEKASKTPGNDKCMDVIKKLCKKQTDSKSHEIKIYKCSLCSVHYTTKETLYEHILEADHSIEDSSKARNCNTCGLKFDISTLPKHILAHHVQLNLKKDQFHIISKEPIAASFRSSSNPSRHGEFADVEFTRPFEHVEKYLQSLPDPANGANHYNEEMRDEEFYNDEIRQNSSDIHFPTGNCKTEYSDSVTTSESPDLFDDDDDDSLLKIRKSINVEDDITERKSACSNMSAKYLIDCYPSTSKGIAKISKDNKKSLETSTSVSDKNTDNETDDDEKNTQNQNLEELSQAGRNSSSDRTLFKCGKCCVHFMKNQYLTNHLKACKSDSVIATVNCSTCGLKFTVNSLAAHNNIHHNKMNLQLKDIEISTTKPICDEDDDDGENTQNETTDLSQAEINSKTLFKCDKCFTHFMKVNHLTNHMKACRSENILPTVDCSLCGLKFSANSLAYHKNIHHNISSQTGKTKTVKISQYKHVNYRKTSFNLRRLKKKRANTHKPDVSSNVEQKSSMKNVESMDKTGKNAYNSFKTKDQTKMKKRLKTTTFNYFNLTQTYLKKLEKKKLDNLLYRCDNCHFHFLTYDSCKSHRFTKCGNMSTRENCNVCGLKFSIHSLARHHYIHHEKMKLKLQDLKIINISKNLRKKKPASTKLKKNSSINADRDLRVLLPKTDITYINDKVKKQAIRGASNSKTLHNILYKCEECFIHYINADDFKKHSCDPHDEIGKDKCVNCKLQFNKNSLLQHNYIHHDVRKLSLSDFTIISELPTNSKVQKNTSKTHITDKPGLTPNKNKPADKPKNKIKIPLVRKYNLSQQNIKALDTKNYDRRLYKCVKCSLHFLKRETLHAHSYNGACGNGLANVQCSICGLSFTPMSLPKHEYVHHKKLKLQQNDFIIRTDYKIENTELKQNVETDNIKPKVTPNVPLLNSNIEFTSDNETENPKLETFNKKQTFTMKTPPSPTKPKVKHVHVNLEKGKVTKIALDKSTTTLLKCPQCPLHFMSKSAHYNHIIKDKHSMPKERCKKCGLYFSLQVLPRHDIIHHKVLKLRLEDFNIVPPVTMPTVYNKNGKFKTVKTAIDTVSSVKTETDIVSSIKTETDIVSSVKTETDIVSSIKTETDIVSSVKTETDIVSSVKTETDIVSSIKTETDIVSSVKTEKEDNPRIISDQNLQQANSHNLQIHNAQDPKEGQSKKIESSRDKIKTALQMIDSSSESSDDDSEDDWKTISSINVDVSRRDLLEPSGSKLDESNVIILDLDEDEVHQTPKSGTDKNTDAGVITYSKRQSKKKENVLYQCRICQICFINKATLRQHMFLRKHVPKQVNKCPVCHYTFSTISLRKHQEIHHTSLKLKREDFTIIYASKKYDVPKSTSPPYIDDEITLSSDDLELVEESSSKSKLSEVLNNKHLKKSTDVVKRPYIDSPPMESDTIYDFKLFKCGKCNVCFIDKETWSDHINHHNMLDQKDYTECKLCGFQFLVASLQEHITANHGKEFELEKVLVTEWCHEDCGMKINTYYATDRVQSELVSTTTDVAKDLVAYVDLTAQNSAGLISKAEEPSSVSIDEQKMKEFENFSVDVETVSEDTSSPVTVEESELNKITKTHIGKNIKLKFKRTYMSKSLKDASLKRQLFE